MDYQRTDREGSGMQRRGFAILDPLVMLACLLIGFTAVVALWYYVGGYLLLWLPLGLVFTVVVAGIIKLLG
jgi:hypothetical protein